MSCLNPISVRRLDLRTNQFVFQKVRCRQCEDCKQSARSAAYIRMKFEDEACSKAKGMIFFFTLTFADEYVPFKFHRMCFDKRYIQEWLQQIRQEFRRKYGYRIKYCLVSELGHVGTHRPHHHGKFYLYPDTKYQLKSWRDGGKNNYKIPVFPHSYEKIIEKLWSYGRCDIQVFDPAKGGNDYISKYISKDVEEEKLFKDIITKIQIKRGKSSPSRHQEYLLKTFPSLHHFMQRYCAFTMFSQGLGSFAPISFEDCVQRKLVSVDGYNYSIPRYYVDRFVRKECLENVPTFTRVDPIYFDGGFANSHFVDWPLLPAERWTRRIRQPFGCMPFLETIKKRVFVPNPLYNKYTLPSEKVLEKYKVMDGLFDFHYENVPMYVFKYVNDKLTKVKAVPRQSEVSSMSTKKHEYEFIHVLDNIESLYYSLPPILQDSCPFDVPQLLLSVPRDWFNDKDNMYLPTEQLFDVVLSLQELSRTASEWRAKSRIYKRELKRKEKERMNSPYARSPLSWSEYRLKSRYFGHFVKSHRNAPKIV